MEQATRDDNFVAHGFLYLWQPDLVWLHALSDLIIALAYFAISVTLVTLLHSRKNAIPYSWILHLCAFCIFLCALSHIVGMISIWYPLYYLHGILKAFTAACAICTALILLPVLPLILKSLDPQPPSSHKNESG